MTDTRATIQRLRALLDHGRTFDLGAECQSSLPALLDRLEKLEWIAVLATALVDDPDSGIVMLKKALDELDK